jgi:GT2 family glycosyltransferase
VVSSAPMRSWSVSVVTPTFNRRERLALVLAALERQSVSLDAIEVVVVDDGSVDGTSDWLSRCQLGFKLVALRQANSGPAAARNAGVTAARNEYILFLDDDVVPERDMLEEHAAAHERAGGDVVVLGTMASLPKYKQPWVSWEQFQLEKQYHAMTRGDYAPTFRQFWTGNASVRRQRLVQAGLFDVALKRGEDVDLGFRLSQLGVGYVFNPRAKGLHHAERSLASFCKAHSAYGEMEVALFERQAGGAEPVLSENWNRLHAVQRTFLELALRSQVGSDTVRRGLCAALESKPAASLPPALSRAACSVLANLLFWDGSRRALGSERFSTMIERRGERS